MSAHTCIWCSTTFQSRQYNADFCGSPCRSAFNNQRARRGAVLYDLEMIRQCDPKSYEDRQLGERVKELTARWSEEDATAKHKRTWKRPYDVMLDTAELLR